MEVDGKAFLKWRLTLKADQRLQKRLKLLTTPLNESIVTVCTWDCQFCGQLGQPDVGENALDAGAEPEEIAVPSADVPNAFAFGKSHTIKDDAGTKETRGYGRLTVERHNAA